MIDFNVEKQNQILQFLKEKRKEIGYTLLDASEILKISPSYLKKLEDGEYKKTNLELLLNYYDLVGIDPQKLLYDLNILKDKPYYKIPIYGDLNAENIVDYILPTENIQFDESFFAYKLKEDYSHDFFKNDIVIVKKASESFNEISETSILFSNKVNKVGIGTIRKIYSENDIASYNSFIISVNYDIFAISNSKKNLPSQIKIYGEIKGIVRLMD